MLYKLYNNVIALSEKKGLSNRKENMGDSTKGVILYFIGGTGYFINTRVNKTVKGEKKL